MNIEDIRVGQYVYVEEGGNLLKCRVVCISCIANPLVEVVAENGIGFHLLPDRLYDEKEVKPLRISALQREIYKISEEIRRKTEEIAKINNGEI